jgi:hypothetical protein
MAYKEALALLVRHLAFALGALLGCSYQSDLDMMNSSPGLALFLAMRQARSIRTSGGHGLGIEHVWRRRSAGSRLRVSALQQLGNAMPNIVPWYARGL